MITRCGAGSVGPTSDSDHMPFRAVLAGQGEVDATQDDLGQGLSWSAVHRVRPRRSLTCPACDGRVHAKVSPAPNRLRFFAHDAADLTCPMRGQSMEHYLLKAEVASALRQVGWTATLEAVGDGWRADVLGTSPDGTQQHAWEVQLSGISVDEVLARSEAMEQSGVSVCWLTDRDSPEAWFGQAPTLRVRASEPQLEASRGTMVTGGLLRFASKWCPNPTQCRTNPRGRRFKRTCRVPGMAGGKLRSQCP